MTPFIVEHNKCVVQKERRKGGQSQGRRKGVIAGERGSGKEDRKKMYELAGSITIKHSFCKYYVIMSEKKFYLVYKIVSYLRKGLILKYKYR